VNNQAFAALNPLLQYVSFNAMEVFPSNNTNAIFYQCSDISITSSNDRAAAKGVIPPRPQLPLATGGYSCTTPPLWQASGTSTGPGGEQTAHVIYYDANQQLVRWDRTPLGSNDAAPLITITNFSDVTQDGTVEYVIEPTNTASPCQLYGGDGFYSWSFGPSAGMVNLRNVTSNGQLLAVWGTAIGGKLCILTCTSPLPDPALCSCSVEQTSVYSYAARLPDSLRVIWQRLLLASFCYAWLMVFS
jgi:hypothetical protein